MIARIAFAIAALLLACPPSVVAAEPFSETVFRARVTDIVASGERPIPATALSETYQMLSVVFLEGNNKGRIIELENTSPFTFEKGDTFYVHRVPGLEGEDTYAVGEPDRLPVLLSLIGAFIVVTLLAAGLAGARSLVALAGSFAAIIFGLLPALSAGAPPVLTSVSFAVGMLAFSMFVTHGFDRKTLVALGGSILSLGFAAFLAQWAVALAKLSGFASDEAVFLNFASGGTLNLPGLLLGGILIGIVGVLNDVSVSQVHTVAEIHGANPSLSRLAVLRRAMKVGREHLGAVVNTLPLAYAGAALPLLLLFSSSDAPLWFIANREIFAVEIIRTAAGGTGLMGSGVISTVLAVFSLIGREPRGTITSN